MTARMSVLLGSVVIGLVSAPIAALKKPRFFWGSAGFDPISFFWVIAFFLFGPVGAFISSAIGALGILLFSKEPTPGLGAVLKFIGTLTVWGTFYAFAAAFSDPAASFVLYYKNIEKYAPAVLVAACVRSLIEVPACYYAIPYFLTRSTHIKTNSRMMIEKFGGIYRFIVMLIALNVWLTILDAFIPWLVVYPTGLYKLARW